MNCGPPKSEQQKGDHQAMLVYKSVLDVDQEKIHLMVID